MATRLVFSFATLLAACVMTGAAVAPATGAGSTQLVCSGTDDPVVTRLCEALQEIVQKAPQVGPHDPGDQALAGRGVPRRFVLDAQSPRPDTLTARLCVEDARGRHCGDEMTLNVTDISRIPDARLQAFARLLIDQGFAQRN